MVCAPALHGGKCPAFLNLLIFPATAPLVTDRASASWVRVRSPVARRTSSAVLPSSHCMRAKYHSADMCHRSWSIFLLGSAAVAPAPSPASSSTSGRGLC